jgi:hypothetical protein
VIKRWSVPGVPFAVSLCLSLATVGTHPFWQDSGLYLVAIKELGILYPPGFILYEVLCFLWTKLFFFVDFTLAVHLFSSFCAALAAGAAAVATRDLLRSRGKIFHVTEEDPGPAADGPAILAGVLLAGGFTFWSTAIYAKGYAFYYLILSLLLWRMIRADESGRRRDFMIAAALIGFSWQAHPSATLMGAAFVLFVAVHARALGAKGIAAGIAVAAAAALGASLALHPLLVAGDPWLVFDRPQGVSGFVRYFLGLRFVGSHGVFGVDGTRVLSFFRYLWEDALGVGLLFVVVGLMRIGHRNRRLLIGLLAWLVPYAVITILFKTEGQHDCWFVAARLPLTLALGVGAWHLAAHFAPRGAALLAAAGVVGTAWAAIANYRDVSQREYLLAEHYARIIVGSVDPNAIVILSGDDSNGLAAYLQRVRGERSDVTLVTSSFLQSEWYDRDLVRRNPGLVAPDYAGLRERFPAADGKQLGAAAFINANAGARPLFCEIAVAPQLLRDGLMLVPAGVHWKVVPAAASAPLPELKYWSFPIEPEQIRPLYRRARGQKVDAGPEGKDVQPQRYERRLAALILMARFRLALALTDHGQLAQAAKLCQSIIDYDDEEFESSPEIIHLLGIAYYGSGQLKEAVKPLQVSAQISRRKENKATALYYLGMIAKKRGDAAEAQRYLQEATSIPGLDPAYLRAMMKNE